MSRKYERLPLSAMTDWLGLSVTPVATPGLAVHIPIVKTDVIDEVYLWGENISSVVVDVTVEFGGVAAKDQMIKSIPAKSSFQIIKGRPVQGGVTIAVFASVTASVNVWGYINRIFK